MIKIDFHRDGQKREMMHSANIKGLVSAFLDTLYLQSKMLLSKVNDLKAYSDFFEAKDRLQSIMTLTETTINAL